MWLDIVICDRIDTWKLAHIGVWKLDATHLKHEYFLLTTLKHQGLILPEKADGMQKLILERSKELRIMLGFEESDTKSDDSKYMMSEEEMKELGLK